MIPSRGLENQNAQTATSDVDHRDARRDGLRLAPIQSRCLEPPGRHTLDALDKQISALLGKNDLALDDYSRAHLLDSQKRIQQVLNAELELRSIN